MLITADQSLAFKACNRTCTALHTPNILETYKKAHLI